VSLFINTILFKIIFLEVQLIDQSYYKRTVQVSVRLYSMLIFPSLSINYCSILFSFARFKNILLYRITKGLTVQKLLLVEYNYGNYKYWWSKKR
jgi:hypothetical protein